jgi:hypothetical protein
MTYVSTHRQLAIGIERSKHVVVRERPDAVTKLWTRLYGESSQRVQLVHRNQDEGDNGYFSPWGYKRSVWPALSHALAPLGLVSMFGGVLGESLTHLCLQECDPITSKCDS